MHILIKILLFILKRIPPIFLVHTVNSILLLKGYRKQVINNNFKSTIGQSLTDHELKSYYTRCLKYIARVLVETITFTPKKSEKLAYSGIEKLEKKAIDKKGLLLMASHYGNWELACINLPKHTNLPCYGVYKPLKNKKVDNALLDVRSQLGLILIPMNSIARTIAENNSKGIPAIYILIADQNPRSASSVVWKDFLGIKTAFPNGLKKFYSKYKLAFAYMQIHPEMKLYHYAVNFVFPSEADHNDPIQWYSNQLEKQIVDKNEYWLWSHKRWKRKYKPKNS